MLGQPIWSTTLDLQLRIDFRALERNDLHARSVELINDEVYWEPKPVKRTSDTNVGKRLRVKKPEFPNSIFLFFSSFDLRTKMPRFVFVVKR